MNPNDPLAQLQAQHADIVRETRAALAELSASVFNRPQLHDCFRGSAAFLRWQTCRERRAALERAIESLTPRAPLALTRTADTTPPPRRRPRTSPRRATAGG